MSAPIEKQTYGDRASKHPVKIAADLLRLMEHKKTNLCVSVDVTTKAEFLRIVNAVGPYFCLLKTHIDIITDFDEDLIKQLVELSTKHEFYIFEDRKFADIGNTVALQYSAGIYKISSWSHIVNAHVVPGEGIITGLGTVGKPLGRGLLLLAEMSSKGTLAKGEYTAKAVAMAERNADYVMGFIAVHRPSFNKSADFLVMSPGVGLAEGGDALGQQYVTPEECVCVRGCDIPIVGRGIYATGDAQERAQAYREACWSAYERRLRE